MSFLKILFFVLLCLLVIIRIYFKAKYYKLFSKDHFRYEPIFQIAVRIFLGSILIILTFFMIFNDTAISFSYLSMPLVLKIIGVVIALIGFVILIWSHLTLKDNFTTTIAIKNNHKLIRNGPYKFIRHPMYISYLIFFLGLFFLSGNWLFGILTNCIILSLMFMRLPFEEEMLIKRFKVYKIYSKRVPKFLPSFWCK